jgi:hypothetical protein
MPPPADDVHYGTVRADADGGVSGGSSLGGELAACPTWEPPGAARVSRWHGCTPSVGSEGRGVMAKKSKKNDKKGKGKKSKKK